MDYLTKFKNRIISPKSPIESNTQLNQFHECWETIQKLQDQIEKTETITERLKQMMEILISEEQEDEMGICLEYLLKHNILKRLIDQPHFRTPTLQFMTELVRQHHHPLLVHHSIHQPILHLFQSDPEPNVIPLLHTICLKIDACPDLLHLFFQPDRFDLFQFLLTFLDHPEVGQTAQDGMTHLIHRMTDPSSHQFLLACSDRLIRHILTADAWLELPPDLAPPLLQHLFEYLESDDLEHQMRALRWLSRLAQDHPECLADQFGPSRFEGQLRPFGVGAAPEVELYFDLVVAMDLPQRGYREYLADIDIRVRSDLRRVRQVGSDLRLVGRLRDILADFFGHPPEFNLVLTGLVCQLACGAWRSLEGWISFSRQKAVYPIFYPVLFDLTEQVARYRMEMVGLDGMLDQTWQDLKLNDCWVHPLSQKNSILNNIIILDESLKELIAIIQVRKSLGIDK